MRMGESLVTTLRESLLADVGSGSLERAERALAPDCYPHALPLTPPDTTLGDTFERALASMRMFFQPIVCTQSGRSVGSEALMRSREPGLPMPMAILEAAAQLDRTAELAARARSVAARDIAAMLRRDGVVFVNVSADDIVSSDLSDAAAPLTRLADRLILELTERTPWDCVQGLHERLRELRERGFGIAIDDFGAGHLRTGHVCPTLVDYLKLDMGLVRSIDESVVQQRIVRDILGICRDHGIAVIAEGVETAAELDCLEALGCDLVQGFYIAHPAP